MCLSMVCHSTSTPVCRSRIQKTNPYFLQFIYYSKHSGATAEAVVVGVGVDAVEDGVGVTALVQEIGEFQAEDALAEFELRGGVEEGHVFVLVSGDLAAHVVIV